MISSPSAAAAAAAAASLTNPQSAPSSITCSSQFKHSDHKRHLQSKTIERESRTKDRYWNYWIEPLPANAHLFPAPKRIGKIVFVFEVFHHYQALLRTKRTSRIIRKDFQEGK
jgi:hypothetical protein